MYKLIAICIYGIDDCSPGEYTDGSSSRIYEEIDECLSDFMNSTNERSVEYVNTTDDIHSSSDMNILPPPSILRPPNISQIILNILNGETREEGNKANQNLSPSARGGIDSKEILLSNKTATTECEVDNGLILITARPRLGWPTRKVTFGK